MTMMAQKFMHKTVIGIVVKWALGKKEGIT